MEPNNCFICNTISVFYNRDLFKTRSKHSQTRICDFICEFNGKLLLEENDWDNLVVCIECLGKIDEYDFANLTAKRIANELRKLISRTKDQIVVTEDVQCHNEMVNKNLHLCRLPELKISRTTVNENKEKGTAKTTLGIQISADKHSNIAANGNKISENSQETLNR